MSKVWIGTSGWNYRDWREKFYPPDVSMKNWLRWYATRFRSAEINASFYRTPSLDAVRAWRDQTPDDFRFAWKASKFITHWKRLSDNCANSLELMETRLEALEPKVAWVLFQLPPQFPANAERLESFFKLLNRKRHYAFEFRHPSWYAEEILDVLREHRAALCISDHYDAPSPWLATARHVYVRGHGPTGRYHDHYPQQTLARWSRQIHDWVAEGRTVGCYFDNDQQAAAPRDATTLRELVEGQTGNEKT